MSSNPDQHSAASSLSVAERAFWTALPVGALVTLLVAMAAYTLPWSFSRPWVPALSAGLDFRVDGLSALMLLMILGVGSAVFIYAGSYLSGHPQQRRAYLLLTLFATAMVGCVSSDNLLLLFLFWELTSLLSFLLVGFNHKDESSRKSAQQAMLITGAGGVFMLGGFVMLGQLTGTWRISAIIAQLPHLPVNTTFYTAIALIMLGAFSKSAQFPFHFWLPDAMSAPTPVSAYLHSATMVKLGVYLLARLDAGMDGYIWWQNSLQIFGSITAAWGMLLTLRERDLKRILAWSTVATLGTLVFIVGMQGYYAAVAVASLLLAHAMYKATLFFIAGNVDHGTGTRNIDYLGMLRKAMPLTATAALFGGLSMAGIPGTFGFIAKEVLLQAKASGSYLAIGGIANTVFTAISIAVAATVALRIFWQARNTKAPPISPHEGGVALVFAPLFLSSMGLVAGFFPGLVQNLMQQAAAAIYPDAIMALPAIQLTLDWHTLASALGSLGVNLVAGILVFLMWDRLYPILDKVLAHLPSGSGIFRNLLKGLSFTAARTSRCLQHGRLSGYHAMLVGTITLGLLITMLISKTWMLPAWSAPSAGAALACAIMVVGAFLVILIHSRLLLALIAGLVGYGCSILFLFTGAPDLAFTQFLTETILIIVITAVLLLLHLDRSANRSPIISAPQWRSVLISVLSASAITALLLTVIAQPFNTLLSTYFGQHSLPDAHGHNVVNVILVDFRGFDTLGEISVVFLALLAAFSLITAIRRRGGSNRTIPDDERTGEVQ